MRLPKPRRIRDEQYLAWIRTQPCLVGSGLDCDGKIDAHHVMPVGCGKVGSKADDRRTVPLCRTGHRHYHDWGRYSFEQMYRVNLESEIARLNALYPGKTEGVSLRVRLPKQPKLRQVVIRCVCGLEHKIPPSKIYMPQGGTFEYRCIKSGKILSVKIA